MIYTVTFNPALDYVIAVDHFAQGKVNRTVKGRYFLWRKRNQCFCAAGKSGS